VKDIIMAVGTWSEAFTAKQIAVTGGTQYVRLRRAAVAQYADSKLHQVFCDHDLA
jgi:hypothetical protein